MIKLSVLVQFMENVNFIKASTFLKKFARSWNSCLQRGVWYIYIGFYWMSNENLQIIFNSFSIHQWNLWRIFVEFSLMRKRLSVNEDSLFCGLGNIRNSLFWWQNFFKLIFSLKNMIILLFLINLKSWLDTL